MTIVFGSPLIKELMDRRKFLRENAKPICPECKEDIQIELVTPKAPAHWKCRMCHTKFEYEP